MSSINDYKWKDLFCVVSFSRFNLLLNQYCNLCSTLSSYNYDGYCCCSLFSSKNDYSHSIFSLISLRRTTTSCVFVFLLLVQNSTAQHTCLVSVHKTFLQFEFSTLLFIKYESNRQVTNFPLQLIYLYVISCVWIFYFLFSCFNVKIDRTISHWTFNRTCSYFLLLPLVHNELFSHFWTPHTKYNHLYSAAKSSGSLLCLYISLYWMEIVYAE